MKTVTLALATLLGCGFVGAALVFVLFNGISLEAFASVLVAAATFVLAYYTWKAVSRTGDVIAGEDRRHQQGLAPLLIIAAGATQRPVGSGSETGIRVSNIGYGLALNIRVKLEGVLHYDVVHQAEDTEENRKRFEGKYDEDRRSWVEGTYHLNVKERESQPLEREIMISALEAGSYYFQPEEAFFGLVYSSPEALYQVAAAYYEDMFANQYATKYLDERLSRYEWVQPKHLRIPNPETR